MNKINLIVESIEEIFSILEESSSVEKASKKLENISKDKHFSLRRKMKDKVYRGYIDGLEYGDSNKIQNKIRRSSAKGEYESPNNRLKRAKEEGDLKKDDKYSIRGRDYFNIQKGDVEGRLKAAKDHSHPTGYKQILKSHNIKESIKEILEVLGIDEISEELPTPQAKQKIHDKKTR